MKSKSISSQEQGQPEAPKGLSEKVKPLSPVELREYEWLYDRRFGGDRNTAQPLSNSEASRLKELMQRVSAEALQALHYEN